ncbi:MAG: aminopeptidase [Anaerolineae bacterium]|nr:aminopeptidase [Anaerolineae bacterium]
MFDARVQKMAEVLIRYSTRVQPGDRVLIRGLSPAAQPLVQALYQETLRAGGRAYIYQHISDEDALALEATQDAALLAEPNPMLQMMYEECNVVIRIEAAENLRALSDYPAPSQQARATARNAPIAIQMRREGANVLRRCTTLFPTQAYAQAAGMSLAQYADFVFRACKLHLDDPIAGWREVQQMQARLVEFLRGKKALHVRGEHIDLHLSIEGRTFLNANGTANFPDGEIFTGPVEDSVNGWVQFTYPAYYNGNEVLGARLTFENGVVTQATAERNADFLNRVLDTDSHARRLGEFAMGTNQDIQHFTGSILFDEKIGGTVHMAVGQGYPQTGSVNQSSVHWDMICDMRQGGEIRVDGELFYKDGQFKV